MESKVTITYQDKRHKINRIRDNKKIAVFSLSESELTQLRKLLAPEWVDASTPPDTDRDVLVVVEGKVYVGYYANEVWLYYDENGANIWNEGVTKWQELPGI